MKTVKARAIAISQFTGEWRKGCSHAEHPEDCDQCTRAFLEAVYATDPGKDGLAKEKAGMGKKLLEATTMVDRLEAMLQLLEMGASGNFEVCCDCLRHVETEGHSAGCGLAISLAAVKKWRAEQ